MKITYAKLLKICIITRSCEGFPVMCKIEINVNEAAIGYVADRKGVLSFGLSWWEWKELFSDPTCSEKKCIEESVPHNLRKEALRLKTCIEDEWHTHGEKIVAWLEELTKWSFPHIPIYICVVPFQCSQVPFPGLPFIFLGHIRKGWHYPETIAHELAHILFNYYTDFSTGSVHPLIQLIEEEIAVRLGHRPSYFAYDIPPGAAWVRTAQKMTNAWKGYLNHKEKYRTIADLVL